MVYAKLLNGQLLYAPRKLELELTVEADGESVTGLYTVYNPASEQYASQGWIPIRYTDPGDAPDGYHFEPTYTEYMTESGSEILQEWELVEDEVSDEISAEEALEIIMGGAV